MRCPEVREVLFAFLDSELDAPLSIDLQRHLERCPHCAREAEVERMIRRRLSAALEPESIETLEVETAVQTLMRRNGGLRTGVRPTTTRTRRRWRDRTAVGVLALGLIAASLGYFSGRSGPAAEPSRLAGLLVDDFEYFLKKGSPLQFTSRDADAVSRWLTEQTALAVSLPRAKDEHCVLLGGRKCKIEGRPAAFAVYEMRGSPAALVILHPAPNTLGGMEAVRRNGQVHWIDRCKDHTVIAREHQGLLYAAVSTLHENELLCLMDDYGQGVYGQHIPGR